MLTGRRQQHSFFYSQTDVLLSATDAHISSYIHLHMDQDTRLYDLNIYMYIYRNKSNLRNITSAVIPFYFDKTVEEQYR